MSSCYASAKTTPPVTGVGEKSRKAVSLGTSFELRPSPGSRDNLIGRNNYLVSTADPPIEGEGWLVGLSRCPFFTQLYLRICHYHGSSSRHRDRRSRVRRNESGWCRSKPGTTPLAKLVPYAYTFRTVCWCLGNGDGYVAERRSRDQNVSGSSLGRSGGRIFFSGVDFLCCLLFRFPFHPRVTAVAHE